MILCLDVGSTWTKVALVTPEGELVRTGQHPTTPPEVLRGIDALRESVGDGEILACSSAGGGLSHRRAHRPPFAPRSIALI